MTAPALPLSKLRLAAVIAACLIPLAAAAAAARMMAVAPAGSRADAAVSGSATSAPSTPVAAAVAPVARRPVVVTAAIVVAPSAKIVTDTIEPDEALSSALSRDGCGADDVSALVRSLKGKLDLRALRAGLSFTIEFPPSSTELARFELKTLSPEGVPRTLTARRVDRPITVDDVDTHFDVVVADAPIETKVEGVSGSVKSSLYQSMLDVGEGATLVDKFADVFAWNVDFYRQTREGDEFKVLVEKKYAGGRFIGYGHVLAAEYVNAGAMYRGFLFSSKDGKESGTYDDEGESLQRAFLKAPMEITHVTSSYGMRFHPLSKGEQFHHGIDYGAPLGTPIWTVADGVVEMAKLNGGAGNMVKIKHMNGFETEYFHMSKLAVKAGARVKQKEIIGYVGSTGMSTGPHLHFGMFKNGEHVDPSKQKLPVSQPVPKPYAGEFKKFMQPLLEQLKTLDRA